MKVSGMKKKFLELLQPEISKEENKNFAYPRLRLIFMNFHINSLILRRRKDTDHHLFLRSFTFYSLF